MADDEHREIGGRVVRALMAEILVANRTVVDDLQISAEHLALAAIRAAAEEAAAQRKHDVARRLQRRHLGDELEGLGHIRRSLFDRATEPRDAPLLNISNRSAPAKGA